MFAINVPLRRHEDVDRLVKAGADSFYCGLNDTVGTSGGGGMNQRQSDQSSFSSIADLERAVHRAHELGREVFIAVNTRILAGPYIEKFIRQLDVAADLGIDSVIVGSMNGLMIARERHPEIKLIGSVGLGILNSRSARFFKDLRIYRAIVSRHLTPAEIAMVCDGAPDIEIEAFLMNGKCGNFDSMCGYDYYDPAGAMANFTGCVFVADKNVTRYRRYACGACALPFFATRPNFAAAKIIGRDFDVESVEKATAHTAMIRTAAINGVSGPEFNEFAMKAFKDIYKKHCGFNCHYPDSAIDEFAMSDKLDGSAIPDDGDCETCGICDGCGSGNPMTGTGKDCGGGW